MTRRSQLEHDTIVKRMADFLITQGCTDVRADRIPEYETPEIIYWEDDDKGHKPDVTAYDEDDTFNIFEIETEDSIDHEHTENQWKLFAAYAEQEDAVFLVVVPRGSKGAAGRRLRELEISAEVLDV